VVRTLTKEQGGWYGLLLQPTLHYAKPWSDGERAMWRERRPLDGDSASQYTAGLYERARNRMARAGEFYDLTKVFAATKETVYSDSVHFAGSTGYKMLTEELERQGLMAKITALYKSWESLEWQRQP